MSTSDLPASGIRLEIHGREPETEIMVLDSTFRPLERQMNHVVLKLPPGLYKIQFRTGGFLQEIHQALEPGSTEVRVEAPWLLFDSPVPLANTRLAQAEHLAAAETTSQDGQVHVQLGSGSQLFVFTRDAEVVGLDHPATGLTLHDIEGQLLVHLRREGVGGAAGRKAWAACHISLAPGAYRLRVDAGLEGVFEQIVVTCAGWQTQVFLLRTRFGVRDTTPVRPDLSNASILLERQGRGFQARDPEVRLTELTRLALSVRQPYLSHIIDLNHHLLKKTSDHPMLGLLIAHSWLLNHASEHTWIGAHRRRLLALALYLQRLIPNHPDVDALRLELGLEPPETFTGRYTSPPMLRGSWSLIVERTKTHPALIPAQSLSSRIARDLWGNSPWLIWQHAADVASRTSPRSVPFALSMLGPASMRSSESPERDEVEELLTELLKRAGIPPSPQTLLEHLDALSIPQLVSRLGLPASTVATALSELRAKLQRTASRRPT